MHSWIWEDYLMTKFHSNTTSERLSRQADIMNQARELFGDEETAMVWLHTPNLAFQNAAPVDYLDTDQRALAVRQALNAIAAGGMA